MVDGKALYHVLKDPGQENDLADKRPEEVAMMRQDYEAWWRSIQPAFEKVARFDLGGAQNPTMLMSHDWFMGEGEGNSAWHHSYVQRNELRNGRFMVDIKKAGRYRMTPMRWPEYVDKPSGCVKVSIAVHPHIDHGTAAVIAKEGSTDPARPVQSFDVVLPAGPASLKSTQTRADGKMFGAYYVKVEYLGKS